MIEPVSSKKPSEINTTTHLPAVVLLTDNRPQELVRALQGLAVQDFLPRDVVVVHSPNDRSLEPETTWPFQIHEVWVDSRNISRARNAAFDAAPEIDFFAFLDDDAVPLRQWYSTLLAASLEGAELLGGPVRDAVGIEWEFRGCLLNPKGDIVNLDRELLDRLTLESPLVRESVIGANFAVSRRVWEAIGGFDEVFSYFLDEGDFCWRAADLGVRPHFLEGMQIVHYKAIGVYRSGDGFPSSYHSLYRSMGYFSFVHGAETYQEEELLGSLLTKWRSLVNSLSAQRLSGALTRDREAQLAASAYAGLVEGISRAISGVRGPSEDPPRITLRITHPADAPNEIHPSVALLCGHFADQVDSGISNYTRQLANALASQRACVTVVAIADSESLQFKDGYWIRNCLIRNPTRLEYPLSGALAFRAAGLRYAAESLAQIKHADVVQYPIWDVEGISIPESVATVVSLHSTYELVGQHHDEWRDSQEAQSHIRFMSQVEAICYGRADALVANSKALVKELEETVEKFPVHKARLVPHFVTPPAEAYPMIIDSSDSAQKPFRLIFIGRPEPRKGIFLLQEIWQGLQTSNIPFELHLVGASDLSRYSSNLSEWVESSRGDSSHQIIQHGRVCEMDRWILLSRADLALVPSRYESFGLVALEAMSVGTPPIASRVGGLAEVVVPWCPANSLPSDDPAVWVERILEIASSRKLLQTLSQSSKIYEAESFSAVSLTHEMLSIYHRVYDAKQGS